MAKNKISSITYDVAELVSVFFLSNTGEEKAMTVFHDFESGQEVYLLLRDGTLQLINAMKHTICAYTSSAMLFAGSYSMIPIRAILSDSGEQGNRTLTITAIGDDNMLTVTISQMVEIGISRQMYFPSYEVTATEENLIIYKTGSYEKSEIQNLRIQAEWDGLYQINGIELDNDGMITIPYIRKRDFGERIRVDMTLTLYPDCTQMQHGVRKMNEEEIRQLCKI